MKMWEIPVIEVLEIADTAWTAFEGEVLDGMYYDCDPLYVES